MSELGFATRDPSTALETQLGQDETLAWALRSDPMHVMLGWVAKAILAIPLGILLAIFVGPFLFFLVPFGSFLGGDLGGVLGFFGTVLGFGVLLVGPSLYCLTYGFLVMNFGRYEYAATDERLIAIKDTPLGTSTSSVPVDRVRDVEYSRGALDKMLGTGNVEIQGVRDADRVDFENIDKGDAVVRAIRDHVDV